MTTKLLIGRQRRDSGLGMRIAKPLLLDAYDHGGRYDLIDCNPAANTRPFFEKMGYRQVFPNFRHREYGESTPLLLVFDDREHLASVPSPFLKVLADRPVDVASVDAFHVALPAAVLRGESHPRRLRACRVSDGAGLHDGSRRSCDPRGRPPTLPSLRGAATRRRRPGMAPSSPRIVQRNQCNARSSTGPRTSAGKALSRRNAVRHGLTANPAAGVAEDPRVFERLLAAIAERLQPADPIEAALVHRIATAIWRQQRAVVAEAALAGAAAAAVVPQRQAVQDYLDIIIDAWKPVTRTFPDPDWSGAKSQKVMKRVWERVGLIDLDERRETEFMRSGAAITAMLKLLISLAIRLEEQRRPFGCDECEQLGWLLGEPAACLPLAEGAVPPHKYPQTTKIFRLIGEALERAEGEPFPKKLEFLLRQQAATFRAQREVCEEPYTSEAWEHKQGAALMLDEGAMNRLLRYEIHADRTLLRALETLARLRGVRVESLSASMTTPAGEGGTLRVEGSTVRIGSPGLAAAG